MDNLFFIISKHLNSILFTIKTIILSCVNLVRLKLKITHIEKLIVSNFDSIYIQLDYLKRSIIQSGIISYKKIDYSCNPNTEEKDNCKNAYTLIVDSNINGEKELISPVNRIKNGSYFLTIKDLPKDTTYLVSLIPQIGMECSYLFDGSAGTKSDGNYIKIEDNSSYNNTLSNKFTVVKTPIPSESNSSVTSYYNGNGIVGDGKNKLSTLDRSQISPFVQRKQSTVISSFVLNNNNEYINVSNNLCEYCEVGAIQAGYFWKDGKYYNNIVNEGVFKDDVGFVNSLGGKGFLCNPFCFKVNTGGNTILKLKFEIQDLGFNLTTIDQSVLNESCINELLIKIERHYNPKPINSMPLNGDINSPEIEYGDGGERYYEPWKFWFEGDLANPSNSKRSWFKKWKSWFKNKVRIHNEWVNYNKDNKNPKPSEEDIDAWKEDNNYKQDHL